MSGPKRNPDKLNTIGVVVVGICGAVLVYVTIVALQAFYMNDTSELQTMKDYGGQDTTARGKRADELRNITEAASNPGGARTYRIHIDHAMKLVIEDAKRTPEHVTGSELPPATKETIAPQYGRPRVGGDTAAPAPAEGAAPAGAAPAGAAPAGAAPAGAAPAGAAPAGAAPAQPTAGPGGAAAPQTPTGSGPGGGPSGPARESAQQPAPPAGQPR
jgi:hypothetical protein